MTLEAIHNDKIKIKKLRLGIKEVKMRECQNTNVRALETSGVSVRWLNLKFGSELPGSRREKRHDLFMIFILGEEETRQLLRKNGAFPRT